MEAGLLPHVLGCRLKSLHTGISDINTWYTVPLCKGGVDVQFPGKAVALWEKLPGELRDAGAVIWCTKGFHGHEES